MQPPPTMNASTSDQGGQAEIDGLEEEIYLEAYTTTRFRTPYRDLLACNGALSPPLR